MPTPSLVGPDRTQHDQIVGSEYPLCVEGRSPAAVTHGQGLRHVLRPFAQRGNRLERPSEIVEIEAGDDDLETGGGQTIRHIDQPVVEELTLVDADDFGPVFY